MDKIRGSNALRIVGVIPARFASTRFPGKPLVLLKGKPILQWVIELALKSTELTEVVVASDDQRILDLAKQLGVKAVLTSVDCATGTDRIFQTMQILSKENKLYDAVINIQGDEPLLPVKYVDLLAQEMRNHPQINMVTLAHPIKAQDIENLNAVKVLVNENREAIYFSRFAMPFSREKSNFFSQEQISKSLLKHIGLYGFKTHFLNQFCAHQQTFIEQAESLEQLRALDMGQKIKVIAVDQPTYGVDTPDDLINLEKIL